MLVILHYLKSEGGFKRHEEFFGFKVGGAEEDGLP